MNDTMIAVSPEIAEVEVASSPLSAQFAAQGYAGPVQVLSPRQCRKFLKTITTKGQPPPLDWLKGHAASSRAFYEIAAHPAILAVVRDLLGDDLMLWGASLLVRQPGAVHPWHADIETAEVSGKTVTVWIGLENTNRDSSLLLIPYSHRFGASVQEVRHQHGKRRGETTDDEIVRWAKERDPRSHLGKLGVLDGEALFFDGRLWHASNNVFNKTRRALLLQYATPDAEICIPDFNNLDWPFQPLRSPKPPCIIVRGSDRFGVNRIVAEPDASPPKPESGLSSRVCPLQVPLPPAAAKGWKPYPLFKGFTPRLRSFSCHVSVLNQNCTPHPPHRHEEEEILFVLAGEVDLLLPDLAASGESPRRRLRAGEFVYYPSQFFHTLQTVSSEPANYLMFKWSTDRPAKAPNSSLPFGQFNLQRSNDERVEAGFRPRLMFEGQTGALQKLRCHVSTLSPGAGYEPHVDPYDVAILALDGELETLGERARPHSVIFYPAGQPHGMRNPGDRPARYVVFEFHGPAKRPFWKRTFKALLNRLRR